MSDVQPPLFQSPDPGKEASQHSVSQTQGDSPRATQPDDYAAYQAWRAQKEEDAKPKDTAKSTAVNSGRGSVPTEASKSEAVSDTIEEEETPQSYVWLPNGEVLLVNDEDLPGSAGNQTLNGHWVKDGKAYDIVAVYPKETTLKESK